MELMRIIKQIYYHSNEKDVFFFFFFCILLYFTTALLVHLGARSVKLPHNKLTFYL